MRYSKGNVNRYLMIIGVVLLAIGVVFTVRAKNQVARDTVAATATVSDYVEVEDYDTATRTDQIDYYPVMTYDVDGTTVESQYSEYELEKTYAIGDTVNIKYNPNDPQEFIIDEDGHRLPFAPMLEIGLGVIVIIIGFIRSVIVGRR